MDQSRVSTVMTSCQSLLLRHEVRKKDKKCQKRITRSFFAFSDAGEEPFKKPAHMVYLDTEACK